MRPNLTILLGILIVAAEVQSQPIPCGGANYIEISGDWICENGDELVGMAAQDQAAFLEQQVTPPSGHWRVSGKLLPGSWEEAGLIFAENAGGNKYAALHFSALEQFIGLGTVNKDTGEFEVFTRLTKEGTVVGGIEREVSPELEIRVQVEIDSASGVLRPTVWWNTFWEPSKTIEVELRRFTLEFPGLWQPRAGWLVFSGQGRFRDLQMEEIPDDCSVSPDDCIFTKTDPDIEFSLSERLLENIGLRFPGEESQQSHRFNVVIPSDVVVDTTSRVGIAVFRHQRDEFYDKSILLGTTDPSSELLPSSYDFSPGDQGFVELSVRWKTPGIHRVWIQDASGRTWFSNPTKVVRERPEYLLVWGDLHSHTANSLDATGTLEHFFDHARNGAFLDFVAVSDHSEHFSQAKFAQQLDMEQDLTEPGRFIPVPAYEWTSSRYGHNNVYFIPREATSGRWIVPRRYASLNADLPNYASPTKHYGKGTDPAVVSLEELAGLIDDDVEDVLLFPHHPANGTFPTDWRFWFPEVQTVLEICSFWGSSEVYGSPTSIFVLAEDYAGPGHYARDALDMGIRIGFIGSSDSHDGQAGYDTGYVTYAEVSHFMDSPHELEGINSQLGSLAGLYVRDLTLEGIFDALRNRRTLASSQERRIRTELHINGHWQGEEVELPRGTTLEITVDVMGQDDLEYIEMIRNGDVFASAPFVQSVSDYHWELTDVVPATGTTYYYVRTKQQDTAEGWSSPIWVTAVEPPPTSTPTPTAEATPTGTDPAEAPTAVHPEFDVDNSGVIDAPDLIEFLKDWHRPVDF